VAGVPGASPQAITSRAFSPFNQTGAPVTDPAGFAFPPSVFIRVHLWLNKSAFSAFRFPHFRFAPIRGGHDFRAQKTLTRGVARPPG
jgi:hypothetical protein